MTPQHKTSTEKASLLPTQFQKDTAKLPSTFVSQKRKPTSALITQEETEIQPAAGVAVGNTSWRCDSRIYGRATINPPIAGVSSEILRQFIGNAFLNELERADISASPFALQEVANGVF